MNNDTAVKVEHISKKYCKSLKRSMIYGASDILRNSVGLNSKPGNLRQEEFWALDDICFELKKGETLGIIGPNGSGKTTLLKMLNGIFWPDKGKISIQGRVGALIEVGAGFHPLLTGRENIYLNGAILGMSKAEIEKKFDAIVDFAGIGDFLDTPVKFYSSGMFVKLGFSIAVHCEPEILLIDEVLAVGDEGFRAKCYNKIAEMQKRCAVILVSHNMSSIARISNKCIVLNEGRIVCLEKAERAIESYYSCFEIDRAFPVLMAGNGEADIHDFKLFNINNEEHENFNFHDDLIVSFSVKVSQKHKKFLISLSFRDYFNNFIAQCHSNQSNVSLENNGSVKNIKITIPEVLFSPGRYNISVLVYDENNKEHLTWHPNIKKFKIIGDFISGANFELLGDWHIS